MAEPTSASTVPDAAVWAGDVVSISSDLYLVGRVGWWAVIAWAIALAVLGASWIQQPDDWVGAAIAIGIFLIGMACCAWVAVRTRYWKKHLACIERDPATTYGSVAWRLWHHARVQSRTEGTIDAGRWITATGPDGPRIMLVNCTLQHFKPDDEVFEEIPLGADQAISKRERRIYFFQLGNCALMLLLGAFFWYRSTVGPPPWMIVPYGCMLLYALYRLGLRPIRFGAVSAAPGLVRATRGETTNEFARENSVLVVHSKGTMLEGCMIASNGKSRKFRFIGGSNDPALLQLVSRWSWRNGAGAKWRGAESREQDSLPQASA